MSNKRIIKELRDFKVGERYIVETINNKMPKYADKFYTGHVFTVVKVKEDDVYVSFDDDIYLSEFSEEIVPVYLLSNNIWNNILVSKIEKRDEDEEILEN